MRIAPWLIMAGLAVALSASAQAPKSPAERVAHFRYLQSIAAKSREIFLRAHELHPRRRDEPLREQNISDYEVREIQELVKEYIPREYLNISPVVTGCACEEGVDCSAQVYIVGMAGPHSRGLQLSRVAKAWRIGAVQKWWLEFYALEAGLDKMTWEAAIEAKWALASRFPGCPKSTTDQTVAARKDAENTW
jgi:hypothetical protein